jgi:hypothetical protein
MLAKPPPALAIVVAVVNGARETGNLGFSGDRATFVVEAELALLKLLLSLTRIVSYNCYMLSDIPLIDREPTIRNGASQSAT